MVDDSGAVVCDGCLDACADEASCGAMGEADSGECLAAAALEVADEPPRLPWQIGAEEEWWRPANDDFAPRVVRSR